MSATSNWKTIREKRVGNDPARVERAREAMVAELRLAGLRKHRKASQAAVANKLAVSQSNISQFERGGDPKLSSVAEYIGALGGTLEIAAVFDDERISLDPVGKIQVKPVATRKSSRRATAGTTRKRSVAK
jgi:transcriptional regulator with XRE-family HTH domain